MSQSFSVVENEAKSMDAKETSNDSSSQAKDISPELRSLGPLEPSKTSLATNAVKGAAAFSKSIAILQTNDGMDTSGKVR